VNVKLNDQRKLNEALYIGSVNSSELLSILLSFFKRAGGISHSVLRYGPSLSGSYLDIVFDSEGSIEGVTSTLSDSEIDALSCHVRAMLVENQKEALAQTICFSPHLTVRGLYRYKDMFQILPIPQSAADVPMIMADHPLILQFKFVSSPDAGINSKRQVKEAATFIRILGVVCRPKILPKSRYTRFFWSTSFDNEMVARWLQEGYGYSGFRPELAEFSAASECPPIKIYPSAEYYGDKFMTDDYEFALPDVVDEYLDKVFALNIEDSRKFSIANTWFSQVHALWYESSSSAFVAGVSAVEALIEKKSDVCKECGQPRHRVTKKFKDFLEEYVPNVKTEFPKELDLIYSVRSDLAHGGRLLLADLEYWNFFGGWREQQEDAIQRNTHEIVASALRNWILKH
jgi:hypothetical protein